MGRAWVIQSLVGEYLGEFPEKKWLSADHIYNNLFINQPFVVFFRTMDGTLHLMEDEMAPMDVTPVDEPFDLYEG